MKCDWFGCLRDGVVTIKAELGESHYCLEHAKDTWEEQSNLLYRVFRQKQDHLDYVFEQAIEAAKKND